MLLYWTTFIFCSCIIINCENQNSMLKCTKTGMLHAIWCDKRVPVGASTAKALNNWGSVTRKRNSVFGQILSTIKIKKLYDWTGSDTLKGYTVGTSTLWALIFWMRLRGNVLPDFSTPISQCYTKNCLDAARCFMLLSWWCPFSAENGHLPTRQFIKMDRLIPVSAPLVRH